MRTIVTAALKYTENKLRACLGVKSRLAIRDLPDEYKRIIDKYFEAEFERLKRERAKANQPEYERLYDAPEERVSLEDAIEIERASWKMTARLVEGTEADSELDGGYSLADKNEVEREEPISVPARENNDTESNAGGETYGLSDNEIDYIAAVYTENGSDKDAVVKRIGMPEDAIAEKINEAFADNFGDVVLEISDSGEYRVIEDYFEEIGEWLQKITK